MIGIKSIRIQTSKGEQVIQVNPSPAKNHAPVPGTDTKETKGGNNESADTNADTKEEKGANNRNEETLGTEVSRTDKIGT